MAKSSKQTKKKKREVTPAADWRSPRVDGVEIDLPSGKVARLRPVDMSVMLLDGTIPDLLSPLAAKSVWLGVDTPSAEDEKGYEKIKEIAPDLLKLYNIVTKAAFVYPRVVDDPKEEDEITLDDIDAVDKVAVFSYVTQGVAVLEFFRDQQSADVGPVPDGENIQSESEPDSGDN